ncbi:MAG TPA: PDZ domain-containing protein, partial [Candidatus Acidoferrales bacterium]|nr:PDZ domain-containing protein [Candidatus Acidoferrales bacterium]
ARKAPFAQYYFLFHIMPNTGGGLEHLNSTQIFLGSDWDADSFAGSAYNGLQSKVEVSAHEFFHAWNVKRVRPKPLGPFDYSREVNTPSLWISEGITDYYAPLALARAGIITPEQYLQQMGQAITQLESSPGRKERSLEDTSWDTWFWYVGEGRFQTNEPNIDFSYYTGGHVMGQLLDLIIRNSTQNKKSLDDWMRLMYSRYALPKPGFTPEDAVRAATEVAATDMSDFFRRYISGKEIPPYEKILGYAGIEIQNGASANRAYFGLGVGRARNPQGSLTIGNVADGGPAQAAGLDRGDVIISINGHAIDASSYAQAIAAAKPGDSVVFTVSHLGAQRDVTVRPSIDPRFTYSLKFTDHPTELQRAIFRSMLGLP